MAINKFNLAKDQRAARKTLITVIEWDNLTGGDVYVCTESKPLDWDTDYTSYYTESSGTYTPVPSATNPPTWAANTYYKKVDRCILGKRTPDSSIEYNVDAEDSTDILGINYHDINKTQPQQSFDPHLILGGDKFSEFLNDIRKRNALTELSQFTVYVITAFISASANETTYYETERHSACTVQYDSIGGEDNVNFPFTVYYSNDITNGFVDALADNFNFVKTLPSP